MDNGLTMLGTPRLIVQPSPIEGQGLFAGVRIEEDELIGEYEGPITQENGPYVLWLLEEDGTTGYGINGQNEMRFLNHAPLPNAEFHNTEIYALRPIEPGEEITVHYGPDWDEPVMERR